MTPEQREKLRKLFRTYKLVTIGEPFCLTEYSTARKAIAELETMLNAVPEEYRDTALFNDAYDDSSASVWLQYKLYETDEQVDVRIDAMDKRQKMYEKKKKENERKTYERLKKKYEKARD